MWIRSEWREVCSLSSRGRDPYCRCKNLITAIPFIEGKKITSIFVNIRKKPKTTNLTKMKILELDFSGRLNSCLFQEYEYDYIFIYVFITGLLGHSVGKLSDAL